MLEVYKVGANGVVDRSVAARADIVVEGSNIVKCDGVPADLDSAVSWKRFQRVLAKNKVAFRVNSPDLLRR